MLFFSNGYKTFALFCFAYKPIKLRNMEFAVSFWLTSEVFVFKQSTGAGRDILVEKLVTSTSRYV